MGPRSSGDAGQRRARLAVSLLFLLYGVVLGTWTARIPDIKRALDLTDGQLSIGLLAFAGGAIAGMQLSGRLVDRTGSARVAIPAALAEGGGLILPALAFNLVSLAVSLFIFGAVHGTLNVAMNVNAVEVQQARGKPIVSSFHAVYSIGGFLGAAIGGLLGSAGLGVTGTFAAVTVLAVVLTGLASSWMLPAGSDRTTGRPSAADAPRGPSVTFLGVLVFCCLVGEGAAADWSAVYLRDTLATGVGFAASAYAAFAIMMTVGRIAGDRLAAAFGPVRLVRGCGILAGTGLAVALLIGNPVGAVVGFGCLGAGLSCIAPQVFATAGSQDPARAGQAIARVASLGFLGFVVGPVVIGAAAEVSGLTLALMIPAVLALFVAGTASALRPRAATVP